MFGRLAAALVSLYHAKPLQKLSGKRLDFAKGLIADAFKSGKIPTDADIKAKGAKVGFDPSTILLIIGILKELWPIVQKIIALFKKQPS